MRSRAAPLVMLLCVGLMVPAAASGSWQRPVEGHAIRAFAVGADRFAAGQHRGVDLAAARGDPVRAACAGRVTFAGSVPGGGLTVSVRCGLLVATYQHLEALAVRRGAHVKAGAPIGAVGRSGLPRSGRPHLHLGARDAATGRYLDPLALLDGPAPAIRAPPLPLPLRPAAVPDGRTPPLGPAPARGRPHPRPVPAARPRALLARAFAPRAAAARQLPWSVWAGLVCVGLGLPMGGVVALRRRRQRAVAAIARTA